MRTAYVYVLLAAVTVLVVADGGAEPDDKPLTLREVRERGVEGQLGVPLGTVVEISGEVVRNPQRGKIQSQIHSKLSISAVDGRALGEPVLYPFVPAHKFTELPEPQVGDTFRYVGYETGGFDGSPGDAVDLFPYPTYAYAFRTHFLVLTRAKGE